MVWPAVATLRYVVRRARTDGPPRPWHSLERTSRANRVNNWLRVPEIHGDNKEPAAGRSRGVIATFEPGLFWFVNQGPDTEQKSPRLVVHDEEDKKNVSRAKYSILSGSQERRSGHGNSSQKLCDGSCRSCPSARAPSSWSSKRAHPIELLLVCQKYLFSSGKEIRFTFVRS